jgi:hypothetical protein
MTVPPNSPPVFTPLRRATRAMRTALYLTGPILWVGSFLVVDFVVQHGREVGLALIILAASFLLALACLIPMRMRRVREESGER